MNLYLTLKWLHVVSSVLLVGTGFGTAFYLFFTHRMASLEAIQVVSRLVVKADTWFTTPAVVVQPLSGLAMMHLAGWTLHQSWLAWALGLYCFAGVCWLPVVWLQIRLRNIALNTRGDISALPPHYWRLARYWEWLGYPAFSAMLVVFYLMVIKPDF